MTDVRDNPPERGNWFWIIVIGVLFAILAYWFYDPIGEVAVPEEPETTLPSDEFKTAPEGGVPVRLPETPMTSKPIETGAPAGSATPSDDASPPPTMAE